jgi:hypothetical protein
MCQTCYGGSIGKSTKAVEAGSTAVAAVLKPHSTFTGGVTDEMERAGSKVAALALNLDSKVIPAAVSH